MFKRNYFTLIHRYVITPDSLKLVWAETSIFTLSTNPIKAFNTLKNLYPSKDGYAIIQLNKI